MDVAKVIIFSSWIVVVQTNVDLSFSQQHSLTLSWCTANQLMFVCFFQLRQPLLCYQALCLSIVKMINAIKCIQASGAVILYLCTVSVQLNITSPHSAAVRFIESRVSLLRFRDRWWRSYMSESASEEVKLSETFQILPVLQKAMFNSKSHHVADMQIIKHYVWSVKIKYKWEQQRQM